MPLVKYTWRHPEGHEVTDQGLFEATSDIKSLVAKTDPVLKVGTLLNIEIVNPLIHEHKYARTAKIGERIFYKCEHCGVVASRRFSIVKGITGDYRREDPYKSSKYETCRSPLKEMPASTKLF